MGLLLAAILLGGSVDQTVARARSRPVREVDPSIMGAWAVLLVLTCVLLGVLGLVSRALGVETVAWPLALLGLAVCFGAAALALGGLLAYAVAQVEKAEAEAEAEHESEQG